MKTFFQIVLIAGLGFVAVLALNHEDSPARLSDIGTVKDDVAISNPDVEEGVTLLVNIQPIDSLLVDEVEVTASSMCCHKTQKKPPVKMLRSLKRWVRVWFTKRNAPQKRNTRLTLITSMILSR